MSASAALFDHRISFQDMDSMCLLHIAQLLELQAYGTHYVMNRKERLCIRIERWPDENWPDGEIYVRLLDVPKSPLFRRGSPCCMPGS